MIHIIKGKTYAIGEQAGRYFFAWGFDFPFTDELPEEDISNEKNGIKWFEAREKAFQAYLDAINE